MYELILYLHSNSILLFYFYSFPRLLVTLCRPTSLYGFMSPSFPDRDRSLDPDQEHARFVSLLSDPQGPRCVTLS